MIKVTTTATVLFSNTGKSVVTFWESVNELRFGQVKNQFSLLLNPNLLYTLELLHRNGEYLHNLIEGEHTSQKNQGRIWQ